MNLSIRWLKDYLPSADSISVSEFAAGMTMSGSKVEGWENESADIDKVVVGKILDIRPNPNSDHLWVCQVEVGQTNPIQIVTGAQNIKVNDLVPVALVGASLPGQIKIHKGKLRGEESNGMLCSLGELNLTTNDFPHNIAEGIFILNDDPELQDAPIGQDICKVIGLNDDKVEFEITSNRPDCLSVRGLAREAHATFEWALQEKVPSYTGVEGEACDYIDVSVESTDLCYRYAAGIVKNVQIKPSPLWLRERLRASGVRPINNLVDITNFVMLEYGQPMHAFDLKYVKEARIVVRNAHPHEKITTLDGVERELSSDMLAICDGRTPIAVAGVMGGEFSGIMKDTVTVVFESAVFNGSNVRATSRKLGLRTESSGRFEKGLDPENCINALNRAFELVEQLECGEVVRGIIDKRGDWTPPQPIDFDHTWINNFLGTNISCGDMMTYLKLLGISVENSKAIIPSSRADLQCKADIAEEVARIYGYNNIPSTPLSGLADAKVTKNQSTIRELEHLLTAYGCYEIQTYSFFSPKCYDKINLPQNASLRNSVIINNPLGEDTGILRTTLLPSICEVIARNINSRNATVKLFEIGTEYHPDPTASLPKEPTRISIAMYGSDCDFFHLKGMVHGVLKQLDIPTDWLSFVPMNDECPFEEAVAFHPGRSAYILMNNVPIAILGELHPQVAENYDIDTKVYTAKINLSELLASNRIARRFTTLPKFPAINRDISLICEADLPAAVIEQAITTGAGSLLENLKLFDVYQGEQIQKGKKSISYNITLRSPEFTLTDAHADETMTSIISELKEIGALLRK